MNTLHLMIGIPGCGKSTYARKLAEDTGGRVVSSDGIREELTGTEEYLHPERDSEVFGIFRSRISAWIRKGDVIADATNTHVKDWRTYIGLCPKESTYRAYWFDIEPDIAMLRMAGRKRQVPREVLERMWRTMQENRRRLPEYFPADRLKIVRADEKF